MSEQEMKDDLWRAKDRIVELENAVRSLNQLWTNEYTAHHKTQLQVIELQKRIMGIKE
jgi:hypothetical protein